MEIQMNDIPSILNKQTDLLTTLVVNSSDKESFFVLISGNSSSITKRYNPTIILDPLKKYEMALVNLETYYSFPNVSTHNNVFTYSADNGATWTTILIDEGCYEIEDLNRYITRRMKLNGHYDSVNNKAYITISPNINTLKSVMDISSGYSVNFTIPNSLNTLLGFNSLIYPSGYSESENIVNIININTIKITSDIIKSSYENGQQINVIYSFFPNVGPGYKIIQEPSNLIYIPLGTSYISMMSVNILDQNNKHIDLRGEEISMRFHIKQV